MCAENKKKEPRGREDVLKAEQVDRKFFDIRKAHQGVLEKKEHARVSVALVEDLWREIMEKFPGEPVEDTKYKKAMRDLNTKIKKLENELLTLQNQEEPAEVAIEAPAGVENKGDKVALVKEKAPRLQVLVELNSEFSSLVYDKVEKALTKIGVETTGKMLEKINQIALAVFDSQKLNDLIWEKAGSKASNEIKHQEIFDKTCLWVAKRIVMDCFEVFFTEGLDGVNDLQGEKIVEAYVNDYKGAKEKRAGAIAPEPAADGGVGVPTPAVEVVGTVIGGGTVPPEGAGVSEPASPATEATAPAPVEASAEEEISGITETLPELKESLKKLKKKYQNVETEKFEFIANQPLARKDKKALKKWMNKEGSVQTFPVRATAKENEFNSRLVEIKKEIEDTKILIAQKEISEARQLDRGKNVVAHQNIHGRLKELPSAVGQQAQADRAVQVATGGGGGARVNYGGGGGGGSAPRAPEALPPVISTRPIEIVSTANTAEITVATPVSSEEEKVKNIEELNKVFGLSSFELLLRSPKFEKIKKSETSRIGRELTDDEIKYLGLLTMGKYFADLQYRGGFKAIFSEKVKAERKSNKIETEKIRRLAEFFRQENLSQGLISVTIRQWEEEIAKLPEEKVKILERFRGMNGKKKLAILLMAAGGALGGAAWGLERMLNSADHLDQTTTTVKGHAPNSEPGEGQLTVRPRGAGAEAGQEILPTDELIKNPQLAEVYKGEVEKLFVKWLPLKKDLTNDSALAPLIRDIDEVLGMQYHKANKAGLIPGNLQDALARGDMESVQDNILARLLPEAAFLLDSGKPNGHLSGGQLVYVEKDGGIIKVDLGNDHTRAFLSGEDGRFLVDENGEVKKETKQGTQPLPDKI